MKVHVMTGGQRLDRFAQQARDAAGAGYAGLVVTESGILARNCHWTHCAHVTASTEATVSSMVRCLMPSYSRIFISS